MGSLCMRLRSYISALGIFVSSTSTISTNELKGKLKMTFSNESNI